MDQDDSSRPLVERVFIAVGLVLAFAGLVGVAWWLLTQTGFASVVRDSSPNWTPSGDVLFASQTDGKTDIVVADRSGGGRHTLIETPGNDGGAVFSRDGSQIAFHSDETGNFEIYVVPAGSTAWKNVTNNPANDQMPSWSPDAKKIVFMSNRGGKDFDLYRMNADGTDVERLTNGGSNWFPDYAPDGNQVAFERDHDVLIMTLATKGERRVTQTPRNGTHPAFSPNGLRLTFASSRNGRSEIFTSAPDGSGAEVKVTMPKGDAIDPHWSPNGQYIAFVHLPSGLANSSANSGQRIVYVVEVESGRLQRVSK